MHDGRDTNGEEIYKDMFPHLWSSVARSLPVDA